MTPAKGSAGAVENGRLLEALAAHHHGPGHACDNGTGIVLLYTLVSIGVIVELVLTFAGGLEWLADRLRERRHRQRRARSEKGEHGAAAQTVDASSPVGDAA
jgi:hypothetical protein